MTNREALTALGLHIFEHNDAETGAATGFSVQPCIVNPAAKPILKVKVDDGESEEDALGRLLTLAQDELA